MPPEDNKEAQPEANATPTQPVDIGNPDSQHNVRLGVDKDTQNHQWKIIKVLLIIFVVMALLGAVVFGLFIWGAGNLFKNTVETQQSEFEEAQQDAEESQQRARDEAAEDQAETEAEAERLRQQAEEESQAEFNDAINNSAP